MEINLLKDWTNVTNTMKKRRFFQLWFECNLEAFVGCHCLFVDEMYFSKPEIWVNIFCLKWEISYLHSAKKIYPVSYFSYPYKDMGEPPTSLHGKLKQLFSFSSLLPLLCIFCTGLLVYNVRHRNHLENRYHHHCMILRQLLVLPFTIEPSIYHLFLLAFIHIPFI